MLFQIIPYHTISYHIIVCHIIIDHTIMSSFGAPSFPCVISAGSFALAGAATGVAALRRPGGYRGQEFLSNIF